MPKKRKANSVKLGLIQMSCDIEPKLNLKKAVAMIESAAAKGARIDIWNRKNEFGWTPLTIARGYRFGNFKPSPVTVEAIDTVMLAAGIRPPTEQEENAKGFDIYAPVPLRTPPR